MCLHSQGWDDECGYRGRKACRAPATVPGPSRGMANGTQTRAGKPESPELGHHTYDVATVLLTRTVKSPPHPGHLGFHSSCVLRCEFSVPS